MSDAQRLIADVRMKHPGPYDNRVGAAKFDPMRLYVCGYDCDWAGPNTSAHAEHLAEEIDKALGGLTAHWAVRYDDGGVTSRPSPGTPAPDVVERVRTHLVGRKIVTGWVSGWSEA
ncbi:hypothetical protein [Mycobacterium phage WXIN]|nr:hypothetical protein [Mycobacterium phage WXIN]